MATWKKVIVSGSQAELAAVTSSVFRVSATQVLGPANTTGGTVITGSFSGSFFGNGSGLTGIVATNATSATSSISASLVQIFDQSTTSATFYPTFVAATSGHPSQSVDVNLTYTPNNDTLNLGNIVVNSGSITTNIANTTANIFNTNATTINLGQAATTMTIGASTGTASFQGNVVIQGGLDVNGTVTTIDTTNLLVADQFVLFGSGSATNKPGGIIVQGQPTPGSGYAFAYDSSTDRWYMQDSGSATTGLGTVTDTTTTMAVVAAQRGVAANRPTDTAGPIYGGQSGYGHLWIDSDVADGTGIWIYV